MYYESHVFFCCNQRENGRRCCQDANATELRDYAKAKLKTLAPLDKGRVRVNIAGCMGRCNEGPVLVIYPEGTWYTYQTQADIDEIIEQHVIQGKPVARLMLQDDVVNDIE